MSQKYRVMMICHYDDTNASGGLEAQARLLSRTLRSTGENVIVLGSTRRLSRARWSDDHGVPVRLFWTYASPQVSGRYLPASIIWAAQLLVWIALNRSKIEVLHCHQIRIHAFVSAIAGWLFGIPSIVKSATGGEGADILTIGSRKYFGPAGRRFVTRHTDVFVATTDSIRTDLLQAEVPEERIRIIPNGLPLPRDTQAKPDLARHGRCLFLGRLAADKNVPAMTRAALTTAPTTGLTLDIYGRGQDAQEVADLIAAQPDRGVRYMGHVDNTIQILETYGWLLLPSKAEGLSNAMLEAMAQGVVPVATRVSGCVDHIFPGETGFFLEGVDQASIEDGLRLISKVTPEAWAEMSGRARSYARARFDIKVVTANYQDLYRSLANDASARSAHA
ncbi:glycosyltransferase family 4 protein [Caulobacter sp.]|uniref:glycosyltransferase family 4 protein n=1 Tax=Caulobacter sp. TaxID=78 RepID=UPI003BB0B927